MKDLESKYFIDRDNKKLLEIQAKRNELESIGLKKVQKDLIYLKSF